MREVKEKSPLKARAVETLKSAPQAAFRRGTDASFQQLRQELRDAAQDGKSDDRYESGKITDTADHAVQEVRHLAEKAVHKLPKTKSEPQREARTANLFHNTNSLDSPCSLTYGTEGLPATEPAAGKSFCARIGFSNQGEAGSSGKRQAAQNARAYTDR